MIHCHGDSVTLVVEDNGCGFDSTVERPKDDGDGFFGLSSIRERAWLVGGQATIQSSPGAGSIVTIIIPLTPKV